MDTRAETTPAAAEGIAGSTTEGVVRIFDTTLRDGEQSPGFTMTAKEKLIMARQLARLGVDTMEAGFPASSPGDFESVREIGHRVEGPLIVGLCRTRRGDIEAGVEALKGAPNWGLHTFIASSALHMKYKLRMEPDEVVRSAIAAVSLARRFTENVEFSPEDATRSDPEFLVRLCSEAIAAGASIINIPDTVGYTSPEEMYALIDRLQNEVRDADQAIFSVHCHNDLGLAVANSIAALRAGARQVECTVNGIGERAGNASLEELVMALRTRPDHYKLETQIHTEEITHTSRLLTQITGMAVQANKAIVGANAFAHEAGIHQDGMLKNRLTYEIMTPASVGLTSSHLVLGKHSGRHALAERMKQLGYELQNQELERVFEEFKRLADLKKVIYDEDLEGLITQGAPDSGRFALHSLHVVSGNVQAPYATVEMMIEGTLRRESAGGDGPVDAIFNAIKTLTNSECVLSEYKVNAITRGTDAQGEVTLFIEENGLSASARGVDPDILIAGARAFISALNRLSLRAQPIQGV